MTTYSEPHGFALTRARVGWILLVAGIMGGMFSPSAVAQMRTAPSNNYYAAFGPFYDGDYKMALSLFTEEWRMGIKTVQSRWIDSICSLTMIGECYYQMGQLDQALDNYTSALKLFLTFPEWMLSVQFTELRPQSAADFRGISWGMSTRHTTPAKINPSMLIGQGDVFATQNSLQLGIPVQTAVLYRVGVPEIAGARRMPSAGGRSFSARCRNMIR